MHYILNNNYASVKAATPGKTFPENKKKRIRNKKM